MGGAERPVGGAAATDSAEHGPRLPPGRYVELPGRGRTWVRELDGPAGAPTLLLLHGWTASADLNWFACFEALGRRYRVVALDHRGHGRGIRSRRRFRLSDCADDAAALLDVLGSGPVVVVGYSMGGPVAQLLVRRHPGTVAGLVLCATAATFSESMSERRNFAALGALGFAARATPLALRRHIATRYFGRADDATFEAWVAEEMHRADWGAILEAGNSLGRFDSRPWIGELDVPAAVVVTGADGVVSPRRQHALAAAIPGATTHLVDGDHAVCATAPHRFLPALLSAVRSVTTRSLVTSPG